VYVVYFVVNKFCYSMNVVILIILVSFIFYKWFLLWFHRARVWYLSLYSVQCKSANSAV